MTINRLLLALLAFIFLPFGAFLGLAMAASTSQGSNQVLPADLGSPIQGNNQALSAGLGGSIGDSAALFAENMIGVPYVYGGNGVNGFDCSGLVWAAYADTPAAFPRMGAIDEYKKTPPVPPNSPLRPGDLVFFADPSGQIAHVGIFIAYLGPSNLPNSVTSVFGSLLGSAYGENPKALMVDAPHSGASVRYDTFGVLPGDMWGNEHYYGASRPALYSK